MTDIIGKQEPGFAFSKKEPPSKVPLCRYFKKGFCGMDKNCPYRHNLPKRPSSNDDSEAQNCKYYKKASCKFASKCWYKHIGPNGKVYPRPDPLNKFIVLGPATKEPAPETKEPAPETKEPAPETKEPDGTEDTVTSVKDSGTSDGNHTKKTIVRKFTKLDILTVSKDCFHYEKEGGCYFGDKCWYTHSKPLANPVNELLPEPALEPEQEPDPNRKMCLNFSFMECGGNCGYVHGDICLNCNRPFLHPFNKKQRDEHSEECKKYGYLAYELPLESTTEAHTEPHSDSSNEVSLEKSSKPELEELTTEAHPEPHTDSSNEVSPEKSSKPEPELEELTTEAHPEPHADSSNEVSPKKSSKSEPEELTTESHPEPQTDSSNEVSPEKSSKSEPEELTTEAHPEPHADSSNEVSPEKSSKSELGLTTEAHPEPHADSSNELLPKESLELEPDKDHKKLCLNFSFLGCELGDKCAYAHGDTCRFCDLPLLHPSDKKDRKMHLEDCKRIYEKDMDIAFKDMISKDKTCVICLESVWGSEKLFTRQKFGIQENCNHIFCLACIRRWRDVKRKNNEPQHCPACRQESFVILPSETWFEDADEKKLWIERYKDVMRARPCRFLVKGRCRNKGKCNYDHDKGKKETFLIENQVVDEIWANLDTEDVTDHQYQNDVWENLDTEDVTDDQYQNDVWENLDTEDVPDHQYQQDTRENLDTEDVADHQYQRDALWHDVQDPDSRIETWLNQTNQYLATQAGEQSVSSNLSDQHQNEEKQVRKDPGTCETPGNQPSEELPSQSSDETRSRNLAETMAQQLEGNIEQEDTVADADESCDVYQDLGTSFETTQDPDDPSAS